ncbi:MAG: hypothetical protein AAFR55_03895 [Pseudomonadota bacterium]
MPLEAPKKPSHFPDNDVDRANVRGDIMSIQVSLNAVALSLALSFLTVLVVSTF